MHGRRLTTATGRPGTAHGSQTSRAARLVVLACGDASHRPQGASAPRRPAAVHRHRRAPVHRLATDAKKGQLADLELRHGRRARGEDRIRCAKDTGLRNLPLKGYAQNQVWCEIVALACELLAWTQLLALAGVARRWEPKRLRLRVFAVAGRLVRGTPPARRDSRAASYGRHPKSPTSRTTQASTPVIRKTEASAARPTRGSLVPPRRTRRRKRDT